MQNPFSFFNLSDFKKWVKNHSEEENNNASLLGKKIKARSNIENLEEKITMESGDSDMVLEEFLKSGGIIVEQDGNKYLIEVESGSFICHKRFLKKIN